MTTLYTIELTHADGRASLWAMPRPQGWCPGFGGHMTAFYELAGMLDDKAVREWLTDCRALSNGFKAHVRVAQARGAAA